MPGVDEWAATTDVSDHTFPGYKVFRITYQVTFEEGVTRTCFCELILPDEEFPRDETPGRVAQRHFSMLTDFVYMEGDEDIEGI